MENARGQRVRIYISHDKAKFLPEVEHTPLMVIEKHMRGNLPITDKDGVIPPLKTEFYSLQLILRTIKPSHQHG